MAQRVVCKRMVGDADLRDDGAAESAVAAFFGSAVSPHYVQTSESAVYSVKADGRSYFLRMIPSNRRTISQIGAELHFVRYLGENGLAVSLPIASRAGEFVEPISGSQTLFLCSVFVAAPGEAVVAFSDDWNEHLFIKWGQTLGRLHFLSESFDAGTLDRWQWHEEPTLQDIPEFAVKELGAIRSALATFRKQSYGLIHGDLGRANFNIYGQDTLTVFDFDDCCLHYFAYDVATALWPLRHQPAENKASYLAWMMKGYTREVSVDDQFEDLLGWMFRLRSVFMYAYHARKWADGQMTPERVKWLDTLCDGFGKQVWV